MTIEAPCQPIVFTPPKVRRFDFVQWLPPSNNEAPSLAVVQEVRPDGSLSLTVFPEPGMSAVNSLLDQQRRVCRHANDPKATTENRRMYGGWRLLDQDVEAQQFRRRMEAFLDEWEATPERKKK